MGRGLTGQIVNELQVKRSATLRERLRSDTRVQHEQVDAAISAIDLGTPEGLGDFLAIQHAALTRLACAEGHDRAEAEAVGSELLDALTADLSALGRDLSDLSVPTLRGHPTAVLYILLGSRLGTQVIARHWQKTASGAALDAGRYLTLDPRKDAWRDFCARAGDIVAEGVEADRIVADASAIFDHYGAVLANIAQGHAPASMRVAHV